MSLRRRVGWRLRLEPGGGGVGLVPGTTEAEPCRREAEKGLEEEWHCVSSGEVEKEKVVIIHLSKGHGRVRWDEAGDVRFGFTSQIQCGGGKEKYFWKTSTAVRGAWGQKGVGAKVAGQGVDLAEALC